MPSVLITGSNRGLGLEWTRQYAGEGWQVYATCRRPEEADDLQALAARQASVTVLPLNVTRSHDIAAVAGELDGHPIDVLLNNAGVYFEHWGKDPLGRIDYADWEETFRVNTLGAVRMTESFVDHVAASERRLVVAISSHMGSITDITTPRDHAYRSSKAALNAAMKGLGFELEDRGIGVLLLHPGWVRTRMGGANAPLAPEESVRGMRRLVEGFRPVQSGHFYRYDGSEIPW